jgi:hypothetical protein
VKLDSMRHQAHSEGVVWADKPHSHRGANQCSSSESAQGHHNLIVKWASQEIA